MECRVWRASFIHAAPGKVNRLGELREYSHGQPPIGLMFLAPGAIYPGIPAQFAYPAALGDLLAAVLAVAAIPAVARDVRGGRLLVWLFNVEGRLDLKHWTPE